MYKDDIEPFDEKDNFCHTTGIQTPQIVFEEICGDELRVNIFRFDIHHDPNPAHLLRDSEYISHTVLYTGHKSEESQ